MSNEDYNFALELTNSNPDAISPGDADAFAEDVCELALEHGIDFREVRPTSVKDE